MKCVTDHDRRVWKSQIGVICVAQPLLAVCLYCGQKNRHSQKWLCYLASIAAA